MIRRRRPQREIPFSFDSFLDVVANVVGIIIRLILVVWVGARSYNSVKDLPPPRGPEPPPAAVESPEPEDPLQHELAGHRRELAEAQARLLEQLRRVELLEKCQGQTGAELEKLTARRQALEAEAAALEQGAAGEGGTLRQAALTLAEVKEKQQKLLAEIRAVEKLPPVRQKLRYQTPVSKPVHSDEIYFECKNGRVTFIETNLLIEEVKRDVQARLDDMRETLRTSRQYTGSVGPVGAFRLQYVVERLRDGVEDVVGTGPLGGKNFPCEVSALIFEPVAAIRGETLEAALATNSEFRQAVDRLDPRLTVVTFNVYPDSFALYRKLRDYLYERNLVVAGWPKAVGDRVIFSPHGKRSRGQ